MNFFSTHLLVAEILLVFISCALAIAPQPRWPFEDLLDVPVPEETVPSSTAVDHAQQQLPQDAREILEAIERETFQEITEHRMLTSDKRQYTPHKCCKIGKKVADKGLHCAIDLMQVEKMNNNVYRRKMKFQGAAMETSPAVSLGYKSLLLRVEKCYPNKAARSMFLKCCEWQLQLSTEMENCRFLVSKEARRECKERVRAREA